MFRGSICWFMKPEGLHGMKLPVSWEFRKKGRSTASRMSSSFKKYGQDEFWGCSEEKWRSRLEMIKEIWKLYRKEGNDFLYSIGTGDKTWVFSYDPENKRQSVEYWLTDSPGVRKFKVVKSSGKLMCTVWIF